MLGRASKSRLPQISRRHLQNSYDELYLPWLCPSIHGSLLRPRTSATATRPRIKPESTPPSLNLVKVHAAASPSGRRGLASAAVDTYDASGVDAIPFAGQTPFPGSSPDPFTGYPAPLLLNVPCTTAKAVFRTHNAISGELEEIHQTLHACLQVGRLERAAALMQRLNQLYQSTSPGLLAAHNEYLRELSWRITREKDQRMLNDLQRWFNMKMKQSGVIPDATTYALMIQASLHGEDRKKVLRTVRRYLRLAEESGLYDETMKNTLALLENDESERLLELLPKRTLQAESVKAIASHEDTSTSEALKAHLDEVKPVQQKGLGLAALRHSLSMFSEPLSPPAEGTQGDDLSNMTQQNELRQRRLEKDTYESAINRWREEHAQQKKIGIDSALTDASIGALMWTWHEALVPLIQEEVRMANEAESKTARSPLDKERCQYGPFLQFLPAEKLSAATILTAMMSLSTDATFDQGLRLVYLVMKIGGNIQDESLAETVRIQAQRNHIDSRKVNDRLLKARAAIMKNRNSRSSYAKLFPAIERNSELLEKLQWSRPLQAKIGSVLLSHLIDVAKIDVVSTRAVKPPVKERQPVFFHTFTYIGGKKNGVVRFNKAILARLTKEPVKSMLSKHLPMVIEPKPWTGFRSGGFLEHSNTVARVRDMDLGRRYVMTASENGDMEQTFAGITVLGTTPWRVNRPVFETMLRAWNNGEEIGKIPAEDPVYELPPEPSNNSTDYPLLRLKWLRELKAIENAKSGLKSVRCFLNFQLEIARAYVDQTFYFPHNVDFRGRAYPMSPLFNHMGADKIRGLLIFAQGKELGASGLRWLKIHLSNVYGYDKASLTEREDFAVQHLSDIYESAENPLGGQRWWLKAEDPWQCLAVCIELRNALESPDPHRFISHTPVHQDGTCNGLQHYAALGGDVIGARQVNLEPGDRPSDIYTAVAELVKAEVSKDAANSNPTAQLLDGKITRKVVKQTVMTNVYGVTFLGAQRQVRKQLDPILSQTTHRADPAFLEAPGYVAKKIFGALSTMFNGAHDIQFWLGDCASRISESLSPEQMDLMLGNVEKVEKRTDFKRAPSVRKTVEGPNAFKTPVIWTNPLRMPCVQPYRKTTAQEVSTNLQNINLKIASPSDPVNKRKQLQAFPPNFIHSLDASHMILTALKCNEMGLTFAAVHDSFWTHASDVDIMNRVIRESFVRMHSENIIDRLAAEFAVRYKGYFYFASVKCSSTVGRKIDEMRTTTNRLGKKKFILASAKDKLEELRAERLRCTLLASKDPEERKQGMSMVTPGSIFEQCTDEKELLPTEELQAGLGQMPSARTIKLQANEQLDVGDISNAKLLDPETDDFDLDVAEDIGSTAQDMEEQPQATKPEKRSTSARRKYKRSERKVQFWLPMTFPPVPKKGEFDVSLLKDSQYFFS